MHFFHHPLHLTQLNIATFHLLYLDLFYMQIQLSEHFTYKKLLRFVLPSIVMMIFTSIYGVVDGLFVSNYVGKTAFAAVNLIMPFLMAISALGFMIGTGGSVSSVSLIKFIVKLRLVSHRKRKAYLLVPCNKISHPAASPYGGY